MSDIAIRTAEKFKIGAPTIPQQAYLVKYGLHEGGICYEFLASSIEETSHYLEVVGFKTKDNTTADTVKNYKVMLEKADKSEYIKLMIPWNNVFYIQALVYRKK
jgi:hypothetical protein